MAKQRQSNNSYEISGLFFFKLGLFPFKWQLSEVTFKKVLWNWIENVSHACFSCSRKVQMKCEQQEGCVAPQAQQTHASFRPCLWASGGEIRGLGSALAGIQPRWDRRWVITPGEHLSWGLSTFVDRYSTGKPQSRSWDGDRSQILDSGLQPQARPSWALIGTWYPSEKQEWQGQSRSGCCSVNKSCDF